ncbi:MAG: 6-phosphogluconolactonase [Propionibacteriaceae bacterium]|jgi:6-phosphogluconolactonase|nr:6-phosphogluconolactonase [Propionibacteriaceae bacterium]
MAAQIIRHLDLNDLAKRAAYRLVDRLVECQANGRVANLCITGGRTTQALFTELSKAMAASPIDRARLEIWWGDERFVPTTHPDRLAAMTLATLARRFPIDPAHTHPMPGSEGQLDSASAAEAYARELGDTKFDICILGIGPAGQTASLYPNQPTPRGQKVIAVRDAPDPPSERITLTPTALSNSAQVWFLATGHEKAQWVRAALDGDRTLPAARIAGREATLWLIDRAAAAEMPYFDCSL